MAVIKEWECLEHGYFEASHPICPGTGCDSSMVNRVFLTPPRIRSQFMKEFDAGIRKSADGLNLTDFRSGKQEGDTAHGGNLASGVLWGNDAAKFLGGDPLTKVQPFEAKLKDGTVWRDPGGMRQAAASGITKSVLPSAELTTTREDSVKPRM